MVKIRLPTQETQETGLIPGSGRCPGEGNGNPLQYPCLESPRTGEPGRLQSVGLQRAEHKRPQHSTEMTTYTTKTLEAHSLVFINARTNRIGSSAAPRQRHPLRDTSPACTHPTSITHHCHPWQNQPQARTPGVGWGAQSCSKNGWSPHFPKPNPRKLKIMAGPSRRPSSSQDGSGNPPWGTFTTHTSVSFLPLSPAWSSKGRICFCC